jgi:hypothetical protein
MSLSDFSLTDVSATAADAVRRREFFLLLSENGIDPEPLHRDLLADLRSSQTDPSKESDSPHGLEADSTQEAETNSSRPLAVSV